MRKLIAVLLLGGCLAWSPAFAAKSKTPKIHPHKSAKVQKKHLKKEQAKGRKQVRKEARKQIKPRAKIRRHKSA
jgi:hypothetical protein